MGMGTVVYCTSTKVRGSCCVRRRTKVKYGYPVVDAYSTALYNAVYIYYISVAYR